MIRRAIRLLLAKVQHGSGNSDASCHQSKMDNRPGKSGSRGSNVNNINSNSPSSIKLSCKEYMVLPISFPSTAMAILQHHLKRSQQSFLAPSLATSIDDAPFFHFSFSSNDSTTHASNLRSVRRSSIHVNRATLLSRDIPDSIPLILTTNVPHWNTVHQRRQNVQWTPPIPCLNHEAAPNTHVAKASAIPLLLKN